MNTEAKGALSVTDTSCTEEHQEREHEIVLNDEIIPIKFKYGTPTILPFEQGVKFMKDGFIVEQVDGSLLELPAVATDNVAAQIKPDECVAKYTELTTSALKLRAGQKAGGEIYLEADDEDRADIVSFLSGEAPTETNVEPEPTEETEPSSPDGENGENSDPDSDDSTEGNTETSTDGAEDEQSEDGSDGDTESSDQEGSPVEESQTEETVEPEEGNETTSGDTQPEDTASEEHDSENPSEDEITTEDGGADEQTFTLDEVEGSTDEALRLAVENGIDINDVEGTGENGNVLKGDVEAHIEKNTPNEGEATADPEAE